jgi:hypothetical protein
MIETGLQGGGLPLEERRGQSADPACAEASCAGAGPGPASPGRNFFLGHQPSYQGLGPRLDGPRTVDVEGLRELMARRELKPADAPGSAVGKDSAEALHCTFFNMPFAGIQTLATV